MVLGVPYVFTAATILIALVAELCACQICLPYPTRSVADELIEAKHIALCRENPDKPFTLKVKEILRGELPHPPLDLFLDSSTRRLLANYPDRSIVCVSPPEPDAVPWKRVATLTPELKPVLDHILSNHDIWVQQPEKRAEYFSRFLDHPNSQLSSLAHLEVARAPYDTIKELADAIPRERIRKFLGNMRMMEWHALYILLLAQSDNPADHQRIRNAAKSHAQYSLNMQTAAWATAYIEIAKEEALEFFDQTYLENPDRTPEEYKAILAAYSVHGTRGHTDLRPRIMQSYQALAQAHPGMIATIVPDLIQWNELGLQKEISRLLTEQPESFGIEETVVLRNYLRDTTKEIVATTPSNRPMVLLLLGLLVVPVLLKLSGQNKLAT